MEINSDGHYPIGKPGQAWTASDKAAWLAAQSVKRSYHEEVVTRVEALADSFSISTYGHLDYPGALYPLYAVAPQAPRPDRPDILVTGGVHGYETSGVQGAIRFMETIAADYGSEFNLYTLPCISPWGYETINRWNPATVDPNRSFRRDSPAPESAMAMAWLAAHGRPFAVHVDLHETTDTDNSEFRPALAARDGQHQDNWNIPDGFYLVGDSQAPAPGFQRAIIDSVEQVTHIAPADDSGRLIGVPLAQRGVINYDAGPLGLCMGLTDAPLRTTTEVYPDSPSANDETCILAQVAALRGALDYLSEKSEGAA